jgi:sarcosine oxidase subunit gamma
MSEPVTALNGASYEGGFAVVREVPLQGMITLRGNLGAAPMKKAVKAATGLGLPGQREIVQDGETAVAWMSPDELLVLCAYDGVADTLDAIGKALGKEHALAVNVSDARASFRISGPKAREVLAKLCPVDLAPDVFAPGMFRRTRMAQVAAAIWLPDAETVQIVCFRSQARYVFDLLSVAAQPGSEAGVY